MAIREWNGSDFMRECYLRSTPSVDLDEVTSENPVNCSDHRLAVSEYNKILREFGVTDEHDQAISRDRMLACNMWCLQSGPQLYNP